MSETKVPAETALAQQLHEAALYFADHCDHGTYSGGPNHGEPYKMCELLASRITHRRCEHYVIEFFDSDGDYRDWKSNDEHFRNRAAAEAQVARRNAIYLKRLNEQNKRIFSARMQSYLEDRALVAAGLRSERDARKEPKEPTLVTELGPHQERYRVVPIEFEDDAR